MNQSRYVNKLIYGLKRDYGKKVSLTRIDSSSVNVETGSKTLSKSAYVVPKAIVLDGFNSTAAFFTSGFASGGFINTNERLVLIDYKDLPRGFEPKVEDYFVIEHKRYNIVTMSSYERQLYMFVVRKVEGAETNEVHILVAFNKLNITQLAEGVL